MAGNDDWGAFGSDDSDSDGDDDDKGNASEKMQGNSTTDDIAKAQDAVASATVLFLTKTFLHSNSKLSLKQRRIAVLTTASKIRGDGTANAAACREEYWTKELTERGFCCANQKTEDAFHFLDAALILCESNDEKGTIILSRVDQAYKNLVPGGLLLLVCPLTNGKSSAVLELMQKDNYAAKWVPTNNNIESIVFETTDFQVIYFQRRLCQIQERSCLWLSSKHSIPNEQIRAEEATVPLSADEIRTSQLAEPSLERAVERMKQYGYCILPRLLNPHESLEWGNAVLKDLHAAAKLLLEQESVDILHPHSSQKDPQSYRELSMREDLRMDLRDGPELRNMRRGSDNTTKVNNRQDAVLKKPIVLQGNSDTVALSEDDDMDQRNTTTSATPNRFFRQNTSILQIVRRTMNPKVGRLYKGNFGRWNFSGSGPDGSFQDLRLSAVGGIVSLPGSADQALHADTPHLFETQTLPAHYINAFTLGCAGDGQVGCTAFIHGSHKIEFTAQYMADPDAGNSSKQASSSDQVYDFLVRPQLELGDVVLFDCRTLHFGLANTSDKVERPLLYCNMTHSWFTDVKNWDNHHPIFKEEAS